MADKHTQLGSKPDSAKSLPHIHTPWVEYEKLYTTGGYSLELVSDLIKGLKLSSIADNCPACQAELGLSQQDTPQPLAKKKSSKIATNEKLRSK